MSKEIDHDYTEEIVCPYCGYEFGDSWEYADYTEIKVECGDHINCGEEFIVYPDITVTYTTRKIKE